MPRTESDSSNSFKKYNYDSRQERKKLKRYLEGFETLEDFIVELTPMFFNGMRGQDKRGHRSKVQFYLEPGAEVALFELYNSIEGLFESKSDMYRSLFAASIPIAHLIIQSNPAQVKKAMKILGQMRVLKNKVKLENLINEFHNLENDIKLSNLDDKEQILKGLNINKHDLTYFIKHGKFPK